MVSWSEKASTLACTERWICQKDDASGGTQDKQQRHNKLSSSHPIISGKHPDLAYPSR